LLTKGEEADGENKKEDKAEGFQDCIGTLSSHRNEECDLKG
jgi:hypothetical protein